MYTVGEESVDIQVRKQESREELSLTDRSK
jgi:hypothetical protein